MNSHFLIISFESLVLSKWELGIYQCILWQTCLTYFGFNYEGLKLVKDPFKILSKGWQKIQKVAYDWARNMASPCASYCAFCKIIVLKG